MKRCEYHKILQVEACCSTFYFDCFNTLLLHKYSPLHFFVCLSDWLLKTYHVHGDLISLAKSLESLFPIVSDFDSIARDIYYHYIDIAGDSFYSFLTAIKSFIDGLLRKLFIPAPYAEKTVSFLAENGGNTKLFVVTDFYLGESFLKPLLEFYFGTKRFEGIICSSDYGCSKGNSLYGVAKSFGGEGLVVDDDYGCCKKALSFFSLRPIWLDARAHYKRYSLFDSNYYRREESCCKKIWNSNPKSFSSNVAFILFDYCRRLYSEAQIGDKIAFFSREGQFIKRCFDEYLRHHQDKRISDSYFLISRIAMLLPTIDVNKTGPNDFAQMFKSRCEWNGLSVSTVLQIVGFNDEEINCFSQMCQCDFQQIMDDVFSCPGYLALWRIPAFKTLLQKKQDDAVNRLVSNIRFASGDRFVIAELGFRGRMQNELRSFIPKNTETIGYYFGLSSCIGERQHSQKKGLLFEYQYGDYATIQQDFYVLEPLLRANHGQVVCFLSDTERIIEDSGLTVFSLYSRTRQELMFEAFKKLCVADKDMPIPQSILSSFGVKAIAKRPQSCRRIDSFYGQYQCSGGVSVSKESFTTCMKRSNGTCRRLKKNLRALLHKIRVLLHWF